MSRPVSNVLLESIIIGIMNVVLIMALLGKLPPLATYFVAGALIHVLFEYSGGNRWWCEQTYKL